MTCSILLNSINGLTLRLPACCPTGESMSLHCLILLDLHLSLDIGSNNCGYYDLQAVLTHQGRSSSSGHYVSWVKRKQGKDSVFCLFSPIVNHFNSLFSTNFIAQWFSNFLVSEPLYILNC